MNLSKLQSFGTKPASGAVLYPGHRHFAQRLLNRRGFLEKAGLSVGAVAGTSLLGNAATPAFGGLAPAANQGRNSTAGVVPQPIPGGLELLGPGTPLFHVFLPASGAEPSTITDFNGFVGWAAVGGQGTHTTGGVSSHLPFEADMRFFMGEYVGVDGKAHHGAFAFI